MQEHTHISYIHSNTLLKILTFNKRCTILPYNSVLTSYNERTNEVTYLFDGYGPSTPYTVSFTLNALCLITGFP